MVMRSEAEIQATHDALILAMQGKLDLGLNEHELSDMRHTVDALCWVLEHSHNETLRERLQTFHRAIKAAGRTFNQGATPPGVETKGGK
jgi:hypothetical protein